MRQCNEMQQETLPFRWTAQREQAATLVAADRLTDEEIAGKLSIDRVTLHRWKQHPEFQARVEQHLEAFRKAVRARGIALLENRVDALNDRWRRLKRVIDERAEEHEGEIAGGGTGLLVRQKKMIGSGAAAQEIEEYAVDTGLLKELREHEKQAAQELGQWAERQDITSAGERVTFYIPSNGREPGDDPGD